LVTIKATRGRQFGMARVGTFASWSARQWAVAVVAAAGAALALGLPTDVVPNPLYTRMTPVQWWNYPILVASSLLIGLTVGTYVRGRSADLRGGRRMTGGGLLSLFAIGCPVCNKLVVLALGVSGALRLFAPIQPLLGLASLGLVAAALWVRLGSAAACSLPTAEQRLPG
jgi:MFS family permease